MTSRSFALLAAVIFAVMAVVHLVRALFGWPITLGMADIPLWVSWIAFIVMGGLAVLGFTSAHR
jgi:hypothetical protein